MDDFQTFLSRPFGSGGRAVQPLEPVDGIPVYEVDRTGLPEAASFLCRSPSLRAILSMEWGVDLRPLEPLYRIFYLFSLGSDSRWIVLVLPVREGERSFPALTPRIHAAKWYEREIRDQFGLVPDGHPDLRRLVRHEHWPRGVHALRKSFPWNTVLERQEGSFRFRQIEGEGVFQVPVGPIHAGIIEPGHFHFTVAGEPILQLEVRHFWKHRGIEKLFENRALSEGTDLAERVSGDTTFGHGLCYCQAVESLLSVEVPPRALYLRTLFLEIERLHNHLGDVGAICNDAAYVLALSHASRMKEKILQLNDRLVGSRFLRGLNRVGGLSRDLTEEQLGTVSRLMEEIEKDYLELSGIIFVNASLTDRLETTGVLSEESAREHSVLGVVARASNIPRDTRRDHPFAAYGRFDLRVPVFKYGDVRARVRIRIEEIQESLNLIKRVCREIPGGSVLEENGNEPAPGRWSLSAVEGWRGEILYFVMAGQNRMIHRCKIRDPSFVNWPALQTAVSGSIIPDFPLINKSFNLSYSGNDL